MTNHKPPQTPKLELEEHLDFQQKQWVFQRVAWLIMLAIVVLGLLGLFGSGPLSTTTLETSAAQLEYDRFARANDPTELQFRLKNAAPGTFMIRLERSLTDHATFETIQPEPATTTLETDWVAYTFDLTERSSSTIRFVFARDSAGALSTRAKINSDGALELWQFAFP
jgi:hypothetical protein